MTEQICTEMRAARKEHICDYCRMPINRGERYERYTGKYDGEIYVWKSHEACAFLAQEVWEYADPDEGMSSDDFYEACCDVCRVFVCPDCEKWDKDNEECGGSGGFCIDKMVALFQTRELYREKRDIYGYSHWKLKERTREPWLKTNISVSPT